MAHRMEKPTSTPSVSSLVLASGSPRRRELLARAGIPLIVIPSAASEDVSPRLGPIEVTQALALRKAEVVARSQREGLVVGADTVIVHAGQILTKPIDVTDAKAMLARLRGDWHQVVTGLAVVDTVSGRRETSAVVTAVKMRNYSDKKIAQYVASGEPLDKAGSYAIQGLGKQLVEAFDGCYNNVVGLPLCELVEHLGRFGYPLLAAGPVCVGPDGHPCPRSTKS